MSKTWLKIIPNAGSQFRRSNSAAGFLANAVSWRIMRVTGRGSVGAAVSGIQFFALTMAVVWSVLVALGSPHSFQTVLGWTDFAWPFSHLFMLVVGIAAWKARVAGRVSI